MKNIKDNLVTILLGILTIGIIVWAIGPIVYAWFSITGDINKWESKNNYRYVSAMPNTNLYIQTYFYNDSLCVFVGNDTIIGNCSHFNIRYFSDLTIVLLDVENDTLVYLVDHNNDVDSIHNNGVRIEHISDGFDNSQFYDKIYKEKSFIEYTPKLGASIIPEEELLTTSSTCSKEDTTINPKEFF